MFWMCLSCELYMIMEEYNTWMERQNDYKFIIAVDERTVPA